jgi:ribosomal protein S4
MKLTITRTFKTNIIYSQKLNITEKIQKLVHLYKASYQDDFIDYTIDNARYPFLKPYKPACLLFSIDQFLAEFEKKNKKRKISEFKLQLQEKKKLTLFYGHLSKKTFDKVLQQSKRDHGYFAKNLISILEHRLDVILYRSRFSLSLCQCRQLIVHHKIKVNNSIVSTPSYHVNPGDIITFLDSNIFLHSVNPIIKKYSTIFLEKKSNASLPLSRNNQIFTASRNSKLLKIMSNSYSLNYQSIALKKRILEQCIYLLLNKIYARKKIKIRCKILETSNNNKKDFFIFLLPNYVKRQTDRFSLFPNHKFGKENNKSQLSKSQNAYKIATYGLLQEWNSKESFKKYSIAKWKKYTVQNLSSKQKLNSLRFTALRAINLEISYRISSLIFLYSPHRVYFPFCIDINAIHRC